MDLNISGSGQITPGEYSTIRISGSGHFGDAVRCQNLYVSGSANGSNVVCEKDFHVSGSSSFSGTVTAGNIAISGGSSFGGDVEAKERIAISGGMRCDGDVKCKQLQVSGKGAVAGDVEAELAKIRGALDCNGLLNAEEVDIEYEKGMEVGSIGGSKIMIYKRHGEEKKKRVRLPLFSSLVKKTTTGEVYVKTSVEGDEIALEGVFTPRVSGRVVAIGAGCVIELVQYSEQVEISPEAKVGRTERI
jgi:cytoskeletal protein CcmA (bactofilin family)